MEGAMDFHSLSRRELQALCKSNKIPANMTNAAMADALKSLQHIEGIEEFMKQAESESQLSPEKMSCKSAMRTPAVQSSRRRAPLPAVSAQRETMAYSTRRSVRLAEKQLSQLSLNERGKTQPIKIQDLSKEISLDLDEDDVQESKTMSGSDMTEVSDESSIVSDQNPKEIESARDYSKEDLQENKIIESSYEDSIVSDEKDVVVDVIMKNDDPIVENEVEEETIILESNESSEIMEELKDEVVILNLEIDQIVSSGKENVEEKSSTPLKDKSLRKLRVMVKSKLSVANNDNEELGKARLALQAVPENHV